MGAEKVAAGWPLLLDPGLESRMRDKTAIPDHIAILGQGGSYAILFRPGPLMQSFPESWNGMDWRAFIDRKSRCHYSEHGRHICRPCIDTFIVVGDNRRWAEISTDSFWARTRLQSVLPQVY